MATDATRAPPGLPTHLPPLFADVSSVNNVGDGDNSLARSSYSHTADNHPIVPVDSNYDESMQWASDNRGMDRGGGQTVVDSDNSNAGSIKRNCIKWLFEGDRLDVNRIQEFIPNWSDILIRLSERVDGDERYVEECVRKSLFDLKRGIELYGKPPEDMVYKIFNKQHAPNVVRAYPQQNWDEKQPLQQQTPPLPQQQQRSYADIRSFEEKLQALRAELQFLRDSYGRMYQEAREKIARCNARIRATEREREQTNMNDRERIDELQRNMMETTTQLNYAQEALDEHAESKRRLEKELRRLTRSVDPSLSAKERDLSGDMRRLTKYVDEYNEMRILLGSCGREKEQLQRMREKHTEELRQLNDNLSSTRTKYMDASRQIEQHISDINAKNGEIERLTKELQDCRFNIEHMRNSGATISVKLQNKEREIEELRQRNETLERDVITIRTQSENVKRVIEQENIALQERYREDSSDKASLLEKLNVELITLRASDKERSMRIDALEKELTATRRDLLAALSERQVYILEQENIERLLASQYQRNLLLDKAKAEQEKLLHDTYVALSKIPKPTTEEGTSALQNAIDNILETNRSYNRLNYIINTTMDLSGGDGGPMSNAATTTSGDGGSNSSGIDSGPPLTPGYSFTTDLLAGIRDGSGDVFNSDQYINRLIAETNVPAMTPVATTVAIPPTEPTASLSSSSSSSRAFFDVLSPEEPATPARPMTPRQPVISESLAAESIRVSPTVPIPTAVTVITTTTTTTAAIPSIAASITSIATATTTTMVTSAPSTDAFLDEITNVSNNEFYSDSAQQRQASRIIHEIESLHEQSTQQSQPSPLIPVTVSAVSQDEGDDDDVVTAPSAALPPTPPSLPHPTPVSYPRPAINMPLLNNYYVTNPPANSLAAELAAADERDRQQRSNYRSKNIRPDTRPYSLTPRPSSLSRASSESSSSVPYESPTPSLSSMAVAPTLAPPPPPQSSVVTLVGSGGASATPVTPQPRPSPPASLTPLPLVSLNSRGSQHYALVHPTDQTSSRISEQRRQRIRESNKERRQDIRIAKQLGDGGSYEETIRETTADYMAVSTPQQQSPASTQQLSSRRRTSIRRDGISRGDDGKPQRDVAAVASPRTGLFSENVTLDQIDLTYITNNDDEEDDAMLGTNNPRIANLVRNYNPPSVLADSIATEDQDNLDSISSNEFDRGSGFMEDSYIGEQQEEEDEDL